MNVLMQIVLEFDDAPQTLLCFFCFCLVAYSVTSSLASFFFDIFCFFS
jgi:hypothetical protein